MIMRKSIMTMLAFLSVLGSVEAQNKNIVTIESRTASEPDMGVDAILNFHGDEYKYSIDSLIIRGEVKAEDFKVLSECCQNGHLRGIDMSECKIENNEIPALAFLPVNANGESSGFKTHLEYITLPKYLKTIGERAFEETDLKSFVFYREMTNVGNGAFNHCQDLHTFIVRQTEPQSCIGYALSALPSTSTVYIPKGTKTKYQQTKGWANVKNLTESEIAYNVKTVTMTGQPLSSVFVDDNMHIDSVAITGALTVNDLYLLGENSRKGLLEGINLEGSQLEGDSLNNAFAGSKLLRYVTLPKTLKTIGQSSFYNTGVLSVEIPSSVEKISTEAFARCSSLTGTFSIPEGVRSICYGAFQGMNNIKSLYIPSTLNTVQEYSLSLSYPFYNLYAEDCCIYINRMTPPLLIPLRYDDCGPLCYETTEEKSLKGWKLYVPVGAKQNYENAEYWKDIPEIIETAELTGSSTDIQAVKNISDNGLAEVYTLSGRLISKGKAMPRLTKGLYIVKSAGTTRKVQISE